MLSPQPYDRAPIIEAVIEVKFSALIEPDLLEKVNRRFAPDYPNEQRIQQLGVEINLDLGNSSNAPRAAVGSHSEGFRRAVMDENEIAMLMPTSFIISQLAPYQGWETFIKRFQRDWTTWKRDVGHRSISRIGVRYINRIDIPLNDKGTIEHRNYLNVWVQLPEHFGPTLAYAAQAVFELSNIKGKLVINTAVALPPPIPGYISFLIDLDLGREIDLPQRDDEMFQLLGEMRIEKNRIFEDCITEKARRLFQ